MKTIELLKSRLEQMTKDFHFLLQENKQLKDKLGQLQDNNDILNRKSEDLLLTINSRLKQEEIN